jgi:hypothetical protein
MTEVEPGLIFPRIQYYRMSALVSALEFRDYGALTWVIFSKDQGRS